MVASTVRLAVVGSPPVFFLLSVFGIALFLGGLTAGTIYVYDRLNRSEQATASPAGARRRLLRYASIAGLSGVFGAAGGGASILSIEGRDFTDVLSSVTGLWSDSTVSPPPVEGVPGLFLTWQRDPTTTMTIDWHTERPSDPRIRVRAGDEDWEEFEAETRPYPATADRESVDDRQIHRVELTGLDPGTEYDFQLAGDERTYSFRTMPVEISPERPLRFATGGDTQSGWNNTKPVNDVARTHDVDFVQWGGDLAYADGSAENVTDWFDWFATNKQTLITEDGRVIPIVVAIGDHEIVDGGRTTDFVNYSQHQAYREYIAPYFYDLFAFPGDPGYGVLDFGEYLSLFCLDSNCSNPIAGAQTDWLARALATRTDRPYLFASYHEAAFPSHRSWESAAKDELRSEWVPLFEAHDLTAAFENGEHTYKRSRPIRAGAVAEDGIRYVGGGAWGVNPRRGDNQDAWYLDSFERDRHALIVELDGSTAEFDVRNEHDERIDSFTLDART